MEQCRCACEAHPLVRSGGSCSSRAQPGSSRANGYGDILADLVAGVLSGSASRTLTAPAERLKTELQLQTGRPQRLATVFRQVWAEGGMRAFFQGNVVNCAKVGPQSAMFFAATDYFKHNLPLSADEKFTQVRSFLCGTLAGVASQLAIYPLEPIKTCMTVAPRHQYSGSFDCARQMVRSGGVSALYRGAGATIAGCIPYAGAQRLVYDMLEDQLARRAPGQPLSPFAHLYCGLVSSVVGMTAAYPLILVRTRLQVQGSLPARSKMVYTGMMDCFRKTLASEGVGGLMKGLCPNLLKAAPAAAVNFALYESTKDCLSRRL